MNKPVTPAKFSTHAHALQTPVSSPPRNSTPAAVAGLLVGTCVISSAGSAGTTTTASARPASARARVRRARIRGRRRTAKVIAVGRTGLEDGSRREGYVGKESKGLIDVF